MTGCAIPAAALAQHIAVLGKAPAIVDPTPLEVAYAAGLFDGEGFVTIAHKTAAGARGLVYTMRIGVSQNDPAPLFWLRDRWGGSVQAMKRRTVRHNVTHVWMCFSRQALAFLVRVQPHLVVKAERAGIAIAFQRSLFNPGAGGHAADYRARCADFKARLNMLNTHKPVPQDAAA